MCLFLVNDSGKSSYPSEDQQSLNLHFITMLLCQLLCFSPERGRTRKKHRKVVKSRLWLSKGEWFVAGDAQRRLQQLA